MHLQLKCHHLEYVFKLGILNFRRHSRALEDVLTEGTHFWLQYLHEPQKHDTLILPHYQQPHWWTILFSSTIKIFQLIIDLKVRWYELENSKISVKCHAISNSNRMVVFTDILLILFYLWNRHNWLLSPEWSISLSIAYQEIVDSGKVKIHLNKNVSKFRLKCFYVIKNRNT